MTHFTLLIAGIMLTTGFVTARAEAQQFGSVYGSCEISYDGSSADIYAINNSNSYLTMNGNVNVSYYSSSNSLITTHSSYVNKSVGAHSWVFLYNDSSISSSAAYCTVDLSQTIQPAAPVNLRLTNAQKTSLSLAWDNGGGGSDYTASYIVSYSRTFTPDCYNGTRLSTTQRSITLAGLVQGSFYYVTVCSVGGNFGGTAPSAVLQAATIAEPSPEVIQVTATSPGLNVASAKWSSGGGSTWDYVVRIGLASNPPESCLPGSVTTSPQAVFSNLQVDTDYVIRVCSRNINGLISDGVSVPVRTQNPNSVALPFIDYFSLPSGSGMSQAWDVVSGSFNIKANEVTTASSGTSIALVKTALTTNISLKVDIDLKELDIENGAGVVARYVKTGSQVSMIVGRIKAKKVGGKQYLAEIVMVKNGQETVLLSKKVKRHDATMELFVSGTQAILKFEGTTIGTATVSVTAPGSIGIIGYSNSEAMDNFSSKSL